MSPGDAPPSHLLGLICMIRSAVRRGQRNFEADIRGHRHQPVIPQTRTPSNGPSISDIVLMAVQDLENFVTSQFNDVEVRDAGAKIQATYGRFKDNYDTVPVR
jgi:hypothetical protein